MLTKQKPISIPELQLHTISLPIRGLSPLVCHNFAEKARREMLEKKLGRAKKGRAPTNQDAEFVASLYWLTEPPEDAEEARDLALSGKARFGMPCVAFKDAGVRAAKGLPGIDMTSARGMFFLRGERVPWHRRDLIEIEGVPAMIEDVVRVKGGGTDLRYRAEFFPWSASIMVDFDPEAITGEQVCGLFNRGGTCAGIGEGRPEKSSLGWGRFEIAGRGKDAR